MSRPKCATTGGYDRLHHKIRARSLDEMKDAEELIDHTLYLEGVPKMQRLGTVHVGETVPEQFKADLKSEQEKVKLLKKEGWLFRKSCGSCSGRQGEAFRSVQARRAAGHPLHSWSNGSPAAARPRLPPSPWPIASQEQWAPRVLRSASGCRDSPKRIGPRAGGRCEQQRGLPARSRPPRPAGLALASWLRPRLEGRGAEGRRHSGSQHIRSPPRCRRDGISPAGRSLTGAAANSRTPGREPTPTHHGKARRRPPFVSRGCFSPKSFPTRKSEEP
ncbi:MAG: hypothetical protein HY581_12260 [Nitrospirae bacterium]|nr:hypothetical protein [Nitrospirota bacterium]